MFTLLGQNDSEAWCSDPNHYHFDGNIISWFERELKTIFQFDFYHLFPGLSWFTMDYFNCSYHEDNVWTWDLGKLVTF